MNKFKSLFKERSKLLFIITSLELILSIWFLSYFNYLDRLNYLESTSYPTKDLALLLQNMFTSTWWGLLILIICLISIFTLIAFIYKEEKFHLISILLWCILLILSINIKDTFINNLSSIGIFLPIIAINIVAFKNQKNIIRKRGYFLYLFPYCF